MCLNTFWNRFFCFNLDNVKKQEYVNTIIFSKLIFDYPLFDLVAKCCFGLKLDISYNVKIDRFVESMLHLKPYVKDFTWMEISHKKISFQKLFWPAEDSTRCYIRTKIWSSAQKPKQDAENMTCWIQFNQIVRRLEIFMDIFILHKCTSFLVTLLYLKYMLCCYTF